MQINVQYLTDSKSNKLAVQVPFKDWSKLIAGYNKIRQYYKLKQDLKESFKEIEEIENGDIEPVTLSEFLNEC
ncbi:MAG: hypothetical protein KAW12_00085 [Candidatus Aminicenantes bacterium]|nr:hypothetical protein [Candidatus Aminicenantes bacterium]